MNPPNTMKHLIFAAFLFAGACSAQTFAPNQRYVPAILTNGSGIATYVYFQIPTNAALGFDASQRMYGMTISDVGKSGIFADLLSKPTTLAGYGITDTLVKSLTPGTQTTLSAGATPTLTITGTATAPILNFGIPAGAVGATGSSGSVGSTGPQGLQGVQGIQGIKGDTGLVGGTGSVGATGSQGIQGPAGSVGSAGSVGATGSTGSQGASGVIAVTAPITNSGTSTSATVGISAASGSAAGSMSSTDKAKLDAYPAYAARSFTNGASRTIQTVAAAGNGWQLSATRDALVSYSAAITTTTSIGGPSAGTIVLEVCSTNSATAANWTTVGTISSSQTATLAVVLNLVSVNGNTICAVVPAGYYTRLRSSVGSGTVSFAYLSGQEVLE